MGRGKSERCGCAALSGQRRLGEAVGDYSRRAWLWGLDDLERESRARPYLVYSFAAGIREDAEARLGANLSRLGGLLFAGRARNEARPGGRDWLFSWRFYRG